jgi:hypothetical protein
MKAKKADKAGNLMYFPNQLAILIHYGDGSQNSHRGG